VKDDSDQEGEEYNAIGDEKRDGQELHAKNQPVRSVGFMEPILDIRESNRSDGENDQEHKRLGGMPESLPKFLGEQSHL